VCALLRIRFKYSQQLPYIVRHHSLSLYFGQEVRHRGTFVDKETDEAARRSERQRVTEQMYRLVLVAMHMESDRLEYHHFELFIRPPFGLHKPSPWQKHRQCCGRVSLGQVDPGLADGEVVRLCQVSGGCQMALVKQEKRLCSSNIRHPKHEAMPVHERFGLLQSSSRAGHISLDQFQAGDKHPVRSEGVNDDLPRHLGTLLCVLRSFLQVIPFVADTGQAKMRFASHQLWRITGQLQAAPVALGRQRQLGVCFL
jgi:hypothetical protein